VHQEHVIDVRNSSMSTTRTFDATLSFCLMGFNTFHVRREVGRSAPSLQFPSLHLSVHLEPQPCVAHAFARGTFARRHTRPIQCAEPSR